MPPALPRAEAGVPVDVRMDVPMDARIDLVDAADEQAWNDTILDTAPVRAPLLRLWRYRAPAVVLGRSQQALARLAQARQSGLHPGRQSGRQSGSQSGPQSGPQSDRSADAALVTGLPLVERRAGGGAVLVGPWMLSMSLVVPVDHGWVAGRSTGASYDELGLAWTEVLHAFGVDARPADEVDAGAAPAGLEWACFAGITRHEVLVGRRKIVGLAQRRHRHGVLYVAGALVDPVPWPSLVATMQPLLAERVAGPGAPRPGAPTVPISDSVTQARGLAAETISIAEARGGSAVAFDAVIEQARARIGERLDAAVMSR